MQLREYLDAMDLKVTAFAQQIGVSDPTVYRWLNGTRVPDPEMMRKVHLATRGMVQPNDWVLEVPA